MHKPSYGKSTLVGVLIISAACNVLAQVDIPNDVKRFRGVEMLDAVKKALKEKYYDPNFRGVDIEANYERAKAEIKKSDRMGRIDAIIAAFLMELDDSHTFFLPDEKVGFPQYGFALKMIGQTCYVTSVTPDSDASVAGLKVGEVITAVETFQPTRDSLWKINYYYRTLTPQPVLRLQVQSPNGSIRDVQVKTNLMTWEKYGKVLEDRKKRPRKNSFQCKPLSPELMACKLDTFSTSTDQIDKMMKIAAPSKQLVLDLRDNGGGYIDTLNYLVGFFFDRDLTIGTEKSRKTSKEQIAKSHKERIYRGGLTVLTDSNSGSASEIFARVIQLEKRGKVVGDQTAGAVMESIRFQALLSPRVQAEFAAVIPYGASITVADLVMSDGKSLEKIGVTPDLLVLPRGADLRAGRDVVMSKAASLQGVAVPPEDAGKLFEKDIDETDFQ